ncbi:MAG: hypothetical protein Q4G64_04420 [bacterium]|nr:hypothetical protein [bacterium]
MAEQKKKVVRAPSKSGASSKPRGTSSGAGGSAAPEWRVTPENKTKATRLRIFAGISWAVAIALEIFAIFFLLNSDRRARLGLRFGWDPGDTGFPGWALTMLIVLFVVIGILAVLGSFLWKRANDLDPASKKDTVRFFVQNQLGAIITLIAFLPLIALVLANKDMDQKQKTIAGVVGGAVAVAAVLLGVDWNPPSIEQKTIEAQWDQQRVIAMTGADEVFWVPGGSVYHLCAEVSPLQQTSTSEEIFAGTVQDAIDGGMERLTKQVQMEINQCGLPQPDDMYLEWEPPANFEDLPVQEDAPVLEPAT